MEVSFYLKRPTSNTKSTIFARISYNGGKLKYYIPEKILPAFWNKEKHRAKETQKFREHPEFNARLNKIESDIYNVFRKYQNDNNNLPPFPDTLKYLLDIEIKKVQPCQSNKITLLGFFQTLIDNTKAGTRLQPKTGKPFSINTVKAYNTTLKNITEFDTYQKENHSDKRPRKRVEFETMDLDLYSDYMEFLVKEKKFTTNTVGKHIKVLKTVLNEATEQKINTNISFRGKRFITIKEDADNIYLNENELQEIEALNLSDNPKLEKVRDLFLIGCRTGLRYSDYTVIKPQHLQDGFIHITQFKTKAPIVIPVHPSVQKIIDKYDGTLPVASSNQKTNEYLKQLGQEKLPGSKDPILGSTVTKTSTKGGVQITKSFKKWELLTTHTARRSFATNEYLAGTPAITIRAITGHKSEVAFLKYIKLTPNEHAKLLKLHWDTRNKLKVV